MLDHGNSNSSLRFAQFELKLKSEELLKGGLLIKLPPQPFKVLAILVENAGELVTREELQRRVWGEDTYVDFDKGLNFCIKQIREALGDNAQSPVFIETLPKRGYRFIAPVERDAAIHAKGEAENDGSDESAAATDAASKPPELGEASQSEKVADTPNSTRRRWRVVIIIFAVTLPLTLYLGWRRFSPSPAPVESKKMLAVLPFENLSGEASEDYFSDGLTEEMISQLGRLHPRQLGVIARTTALRYKKTAKDIRQIGQELGVGFVLEGSVRREAGKVRITAQLIQVSDQTHLWSESYERGERDLLQIQSQVASRVARSLALELLPSTSSASTAAKTNNPEAYDAYLKGLFLVTKDTVPDLERSIPYFDQATESDPNFAPAFAAAVDARVLLATWKNIPAHKMLEKAKADALRAIELDPALAEGYGALGAVNFWFEWDWSQAEKNIKRAVALNPSNPNLHILYADFLMTQGQPEEAASHLRQAVALDPVSLLTNGLSAYCYLRLRRYDDAITQANRMLELEPKSPAAHDCLINAYRYKTMYEEMRAVILKQMTENNAKRELIESVRQGDMKTTVARLEREQYDKTIAARSKDEWASAIWLARLAARIGERERAFEWLEKAFEERLPGLVFLGIHPDFDSLRQDSRYMEFVRRLGVKS